MCAYITLVEKRTFIIGIIVSLLLSNCKKKKEKKGRHAQMHKLCVELSYINEKGRILTQFFKRKNINNYTTNRNVNTHNFN